MSVSDSERKSIKIGREIHQAVVDEGKAEAARLGCRVFAYLDHDLIGTGKLPFVRWDERTGEVSRRFSPGLSKRIRDNVGHLKVYFDYVLAWDRHDTPPLPG